MDGIKVISYGMDYSKMTSKLSEQEYEFHKICARVSEIQSGGYAVKWNEPTLHGTKAKFKMCESQEEWDKQFKYLKADIDCYNKKFDKNLKLEVDV